MFTPRWRVVTTEPGDSSSDRVKGVPRVLSPSAPREPRLGRSRRAAGGRRRGSRAGLARGLRRSHAGPRALPLVRGHDRCRPPARRQRGRRPAGYGLRAGPVPHGLRPAHHDGGRQAGADDRDRGRVRPPIIESDLATYSTTVRPAGLHHGQRLLQQGEPARPSSPLPPTRRAAGPSRSRSTSRSPTRSARAARSSWSRPTTTPSGTSRRPSTRPPRWAPPSSRTATAAASSRRPIRAYKHPFTAVVASTGDSDYGGPQYPATDPHVVAVGGTHLALGGGQVTAGLETVVERHRQRVQRLHQGAEVPGRRSPNWAPRAAATKRGDRRRVGRRRPEHRRGGAVQRLLAPGRRNQPVGPADRRRLRPRGQRLEHRRTPPCWPTRARRACTTSPSATTSARAATAAPRSATPTPATTGRRAWERRRGSAPSKAG